MNSREQDAIHPASQTDAGHSPADAPLPAVEQVDDLSAAQGSVEFRDQQSVTFDLKNINDCRFLFGKQAEAVHSNAHNRSAKTSFVMASVDRNTITISPVPNK